jgi:hypothetical protein
MRMSTSRFVAVKEKLGTYPHYVAKDGSIRTRVHLLIVRFNRSLLGFSIINPSK